MSATTPGHAPDGRTPWIVVDDLGAAVTRARQHSERLVVDLENTLVGYGSSAEERQEALEAAVALVAATGGIRRLAFVSNGRFTLPDLHHPDLTIDTVTAARKPYVALPPLRHLRRDLAGATVYGDQPLTDGMLARRLGGIWLQPRSAHEAAFAAADALEPWWPRIMRAAGRRTLRRHFALLDEVEEAQAAG